MSEMASDQSGPPVRFVMDVPGDWPHLQILTETEGLEFEELDPEQNPELIELLRQVDPSDGTRFVAAIMSADDPPIPLGTMLVNHSANAGRVMAGLLGVEADADEVPALAQIGRLKDVTATTEHFDLAGIVSCVSARRRPPANSTNGFETALRAYLIPQPHTFKAVLVVFMAPYQDNVPAELARIGDEIVATFVWQW